MNITITYNNKNHVIIFITGSILTIWHNRCPLWVFDPTAAKTLRRGAFHPSSTEDTETTCGSLSVVSILASSPTAMDRDVKGGSINKRGTSTNNNMKNSWIQCQQKMWCIIGKLAYNSATSFFLGSALCYMYLWFDEQTQLEVPTPPVASTKLWPSKRGHCQIDSRLTQA